ncbi:MAG: PAC2 family protein [Chloroflexi bacterium]|nr:PAC2 family protein [Chloroflexota bacterium]
MDELIWQERPQLRRPVLVVALGGWSDAGEVGTWSVDWLQRTYQARPIATIPGEDFLLLTHRRPLVQLGPDGQRVITWPEYRFTCAAMPGDRDVVLLAGPEPHLRWKTFTAAVLEVVQTLGIDLMVSVGGLAGMVLHSDPPRVTGSANTAELVTRLGAAATVSRYQGPAGLLSVLVVAGRDAGLATASIWGNVPHYLQASPNLRVGVALLEQLARLLGVSFDLGPARTQADRFDADVAAAIAQDPSATRYVRQLEDQLRGPTSSGLSQHDNPAGPSEREELPPTEHLIADLEEFLRRRQTGEQE